MKIKINNTKYYQNGNTIVCKIDVQYEYEEDLKRIKDMFDEYMIHLSKKDRNTTNWYCSEFIGKSFIGKAKLQEGDVFDEKLGKRIAESKAKLKAFQFLVKMTNRIEDEEYKKYRSISELGNKAIGLVHQEMLHLNKLIK